MFNFILLIMRAIFFLFPSKQLDMIVEKAILKKANEILERKNKIRIKFRFFDRLFYAVICILSEKAKGFVTLIKPNTILKWKRNLIKKFWTFPSYKSRPGRPPVSGWIKKLILDMKNKNLHWVYKRIQGELLKLRIDQRREILDQFIIINQNQLYTILKEYIKYYNTKRPHQGIKQRIPKGNICRNLGRIKSRPILFGLNYEYYREAS